MQLHGEAPNPISQQLSPADDNPMRACEAILEYHKSFSPRREMMCQHQGFSDTFGLQNTRGSLMGSMVFRPTVSQRDIAWHDCCLWMESFEQILDCLEDDTVSQVGTVDLSGDGYFQVLHARFGSLAADLFVDRNTSRSTYGIVFS